MPNDPMWNYIRVRIWSLDPSSDDSIVVVRGSDNGIYYRMYYNGMI
jgi:hypothetical protein